MAKITSKLQVTVPKAIAQRYGIEPGDEVRFEPAGEVIRIVPARSSAALPLDKETRLALFDAATRRQRDRDRAMRGGAEASGRGWRREDLYTRGNAD